MSNLNAPLNLLNHAVRDGGLNAGANSMSDADGGMPEQRGSFDNTGGSGSTTPRSVGQGTSANLSSRTQFLKLFCHSGLSASSKRERPHII